MEFLLLELNSYNSERLTSDLSVRKVFEKLLKRRKNPERKFLVVVSGLHQNTKVFLINCILQISSFLYVNKKKLNGKFRIYV